jgi:RNA polymerase sigma-70 factor (ECF subfamily)
VGRIEKTVTDSAVDRGGQPSGGTSLSLLDRVRTHDQEAWRRLVAVYGPLVYDWCLRAGLQRADAADVGQEVFASVARTIGTFRRDREGDSFRGWLYTITRNKLRDRRAGPGGIGAGGSEAHRRLGELPAPIEPSEPCATETAALCRRAMEAVRCEFEPSTWTAFWRTHVEGDSPADVAAALCLTAGAVYTAKSRVLRRLREEFASLADFDPAGVSGE